MIEVPIMRPVLNALLYHPVRLIALTPAHAGLESEELTIVTNDRERLHGWWISARAPRVGHILLCHGNSGNVGDRVTHAVALTAAGFDVLLFDYRGFGLSTGRPSEAGTYRDAAAVLAAALARPAVDRARVFYLGESLGGAVALALALETPPRGLILQSTFTSIRAAARRHFPLIPSLLVPDAYPSLRRIGQLRAPLLILHGDRDEVVPVEHATALIEAAPEPKRIQIFAGLGHGDLIERLGTGYAAEIAGWAHAIES